MQTPRNFLFLVLLLSIIAGFSPLKSNRNPVVEGVVLAGDTGKPLSNAHVYIVHGEEEALTNSNGQFSIETSRKFPLVLTVEHPGYQKFRGTVAASGQKQVVKLKK